MPEPQSLVVPPYVIRELSSAYVPPDPTSTDPRVAARDPFTAKLWECHEHAEKASNKKTLYGLKSLMPDSYYIHAVKELHQPGHIERCGLKSSNSYMYRSLKNKFDRNVRFILFDVDLSAFSAMDFGSGCGASAPALYVVRRSAAALDLPPVSCCKRVIPIGQIRALLERLHRTGNCRVVGMEKKVSEEYYGVTRAAMRFFQQHCETCKEHQQLERVQQIVRPIVSLHPRHRYVVDLIQMDPCEVKHEGTYRYIVTMVDHFSRFRWTAALQDKRAATVLKELRQWWTAYGKPDILQSDNGKEFVAEEVKEFCRQWGVRKRHSRPYKPSTNGSVERANRDVEERIARWQKENPSKVWVEGLIITTNNFNRNWTRCHNGKPIEVFNKDGPPADERCQVMDESMQPVADWSDVETDTEEVDDRHVDEPRVVAAEGNEDEEDDDEDVELSVGAPQCQQWDAQESRMDSPTAPARLSDAEEKVLDARVETGSDDAFGMVVARGAAAADVKGDCDKESVIIVQHPLGEPEDNVPDEEAPASNDLRLVGVGQIDDLCYPQWKRISLQLWSRMWRAGVPGMGDCGVIAPLAAHRSYYYNRKTTGLSEAAIMAERNASVEFLDANIARVGAEQRMAVDVEELRGTITHLNSHVAVEYLWLYAMRYHVNIYLVEVRVVDLTATKETTSTFSIRLITPENGDQNMEPIASQQPNTIAVYLHNIRESDYKKGAVDVGKSGKKEEPPPKVDECSGEKASRKVRGGLGHFEYLVDKTTRRSCWRTDDEVVQHILQPALHESYRIHYLNNYTERWSKSHNRRTTQRLPNIPIGDIAMLMISDYMREKSLFDGAGLRNMVVKVIGKIDGVPAHYEVLSHAGVVVTKPLQQEFRLLGQDVDPDLRARVVTDEMRSESEKVGLMQAWNFFLERRRSRRFPNSSPPQVKQSQEATQTQQLNQLLQSSSSSSPPGGPDSDGLAQTEPAFGANDDSTDTAPTIQPTLLLICCSCKQDIHLPKGDVPAVCLGLCQQPMHANAGTCRASKQWVKAGEGTVCCSKACAALFCRF
jgi:hypothetical protein